MSEATVNLLRIGRLGLEVGKRAVESSASRRLFKEFVFVEGSDGRKRPRWSGTYVFLLWLDSLR